jgi:hypothetical protein
MAQLAAFPNVPNRQRGRHSTERSDASHRAHPLHTQARGDDSPPRLGSGLENCSRQRGPKVALNLPFDDLEPTAH